MFEKDSPQDLLLRGFSREYFQQIAAETRKEKYGAEYTLASGSVLGDAARETFAEHMADDEFRKKIA